MRKPGGSEVLLKSICSRLGWTYRKWTRGPKASHHRPFQEKDAGDPAETDGVGSTRRLRSPQTPEFLQIGGLADGVSALIV